MNTLQHHGILGMKWGVRRYQNPDGTLTPAGYKRYRRVLDAGWEYKQAKDAANKQSEREITLAKRDGFITRRNQNVKEALRNYYAVDENFRKENAKTVEMHRHADDLWRKYQRRKDRMSVKDQNAWRSLSWKEEDKIIRSYGEMKTAQVSQITKNKGKQTINRLLA